MTHAHCSVIGNLVLIVILGVRSKGPYSKDLKVPTLPPLFNKKQGDKNWKLPHRVLPTALSLYRMGVWKSPLCHRCGERDTIEHAMIKCPLVDTFWRQVQHLINKVTNSTLPLTDDIKIIGRLPHRIDPPNHSQDRPCKLDIYNSSLCNLKIRGICFPTIIGNLTIDLDWKWY